MSVSESTAENNHMSLLTKSHVIAIRPIHKGTACAIAHIGLGPSLSLKGFKVIQQPSQREWVNPPRREWQCSNGKRHFAPPIERSGSLNKRIEQVIPEAWERSEGGRAHA